MLLAHSLGPARKILRIRQPQSSKRFWTQRRLWGGLLAESTKKMKENDTTNGDSFSVMPQQSWLVGVVESEQQAIRLGPKHFVSGFDWLVDEGTAVADRFYNTTGAERAPRTVIGVTADGVLLILG